MTLEDYTERLKRLSTTYADKAKEAVFVPAANELLAAIKNRIVLDGKNSQNASTGQYDTKSAYFGPNAFHKKVFDAKGKTGEKVFKNGKPHKTEYFPSGYKGLREKQGNPTNIMNMSYSGSTLLSYIMEAQDNQILLGMSNSEAAKIRQGQEKKRGKIFYATKNEIEDYSKNVREESEKLTKQIFG